MAGPFSNFTWTNTGNYPAGPVWGGTPIATAPVGTFFTPATPFTADNMNYILGQVSGNLAGLVTAATSTPALNWCPVIFPSLGFDSSEIFIQAMCPIFVSSGGNPLAPQWVIVTADSSGSGNIPLKVWQGYGLDGAWSTSWTQLGGTVSSLANFSGCAVCEDVSGNLWMVVVSKPLSTEANLYRLTSGTWSLITTFNVVTPTDIAIRSFSPLTGHLQIIVAVGGSPSLFVYDTVTTTVTSVTWPSSGSSSTNKVGLRCSNPPFTAGGSLWAWTSGNSGTSAQVLMHTTDGITWTNVAPAWPTGSSVTGFCAAPTTLSATGYLASIETSGGFTQFFSSADGVTWGTTPIASPSDLSAPVVDMDGLGSTIVATLADNGTGGTVGSIWSPDSGKSWYPGSMTLPGSESGTIGPYMRGRLIGNGQGLCAFNNIYFRFSAVSGVPLTGAL